MKSEDEIFLHALDLPPAERTAYLDEACADSPALRQRIERLLTASESTAGLIDRGLDEVRAAAAAEGEAGPGDVIGGYTLVRRLGDGGCGVVWLAEQTQPMRRQVALKVIRLGMDTTEVIRRFEAERQALALMDHADIARVFDAGTTPTGRPFFVMEFVDGRPITTYCDEHRLSVAERLSLFCRVCDAIQHAHHKGIIHRDVKPSNVLVAPPAGGSGAPVLKVIDFGIAKAIEQRLTDTTLVTQIGQFMGTPAYMSPEQLDQAGSDVDTRTDVYSLGVLLYEMLAGAPPFEPKALMAAGLEAMWKQIREIDPPRPSTRLQTLSPEQLQTTATSRVMDPVKLVHRITGDLDWIVMRCLEKQRTRRYATPAGLAADIGRYLANEPIEARPAGAGYRFAKLVRRNRLVFGAAAAVSVAALTGTAVSTWQAVRANRAEVAARAAEATAREEAAIAGAVRDFLQTDLLRQADPNWQADSLETVDPDLKVRDALERAAAQVGERFAAQPLLEAEVRQSIGEAYQGLGLTAEAAVQLERALELRRTHLGHQHVDTLRTQRDLGRAWMDINRAADAVTLLRELGELVTPEMPAALRIDAQTGLGLALQKTGDFVAAEPLLVAALADWEALAGPEDPRTLMAVRNLGALYHEQGRLAEAEQMQRRALAVYRRDLGIEHPATLAMLNNVATVTKDRGDVAAAVGLLEEMLEGYRRVLGAEHQDTIVAMINLAGAYHDQSRLEDALALETEALDIARRVLGGDHQLSLTLMNNMASQLNRLGRVDESIAMREQMQEGLEKAFGPDHPNTMMAMANLGSDYTRAGRLAEAGPVLRESSRRLNAKLGEEHPAAISVLALVAMNTLQEGNLPEALTLWQHVRDLRLRTAGPSHRQTFIATERLSQTLLSMERAAEAEPLLQELVAARAEAEPGKGATFVSQAMLGDALLRMERAVEAEPWLLSGYEGLSALAAPVPPEFGRTRREVMQNLVRCYAALGRPEEAAVWQARLDAEPVSP
ncbi:serine/threonine-protein kinase [Actomonas aquatica]|uniref:Serine/threonine-protein kinase n=1 Tax=Actomonas aquatica TaxID=2866162 RepID=A0ABZ1C831_9BACT|nr:serine/threonine-protein kinase [Opitutus sp. WL0086]WRQ86460.1 serine/threonine-protein kinase [Opitutus sp. WL0086]